MADPLPTNVGFIGLGVMGYPMVQNLIAKLPSQSRIHIYDIVDELVQKIAAEGGDRIVVCSSARDVANSSQTILTMLPEGKHVEACYLTEATGVLAADLTSQTLIDCSTIDTASSSAVSEALTSRYPSCTFVDAPVSGGVLGAQNATMTFMLGMSASSRSLPSIHAILSLMGGNIIPCGGPTLGLIAKLCNNYCSGLIAIATSEAMNIGIKSGMDPRVLSDVFKVSLAGSTINEKWNPCPGVVPSAPASNGYKPGFRLELMRKDFNLAVETAERVGAKLALGQTGLDVYTKAMEDDRCKGLDSRVVYRYLDGEEDWKQKLGIDDEAEKKA